MSLKLFINFYIVFFIFYNLKKRKENVVNNRFYLRIIMIIWMYYLIELFLYEMVLFCRKFFIVLLN